MYNTKTNYSLILPQGCKPCGAVGLAGGAGYYAASAVNWGTVGGALADAGKATGKFLWDAKFTIAGGFADGFQQGVSKEKQYLSYLDGLELTNGNVLKKSDFKLSFKDSDNFTFPGNANYLGFKGGKHHINFDIGDYEETPDNIRALTIHEAEGHGIRGFGYGDHYKAYYLTIRNKYWSKTTMKFKKHILKQTLQQHFNHFGNSNLPTDILREYHQYMK